MLLRRLIPCILASLIGCQPHAGGTEHGHGAHEDDHHGQDAASIVLTRYSEQTELFVEFPPLVAGERSAFAAHLTRLSDFKPVKAGEVTLELEGAGGVQAFRVIKPAQPGIFRPVAIPSTPGEVEMTLIWSHEGRDDRHPLGRWTVARTPESALASGGDDEGDITLLKEQQWFLDFATAPVQRHTLRPQFAVYGTLRASPSGQVTLDAPLSGQLIRSEHHPWPSVGQQVEAGQVLAALIPRLKDGGDDLASLTMDVRQARMEVKHLQEQADRLAVLFDQGVIPENRLIIARDKVEHERVALTAAQQRLRQHKRAHGESVELQVRAPFAGEVKEIFRVPDTTVEEGSSLFQITESRSLWLEVQVPESQLTQLAATPEGWFSLPGDPRHHVLRANARIPGTSPVDPETRTASLRFALEDPTLTLGAHARVYLYTQPPTEALAVPRSAVLHEAGEDLVFVQRSGESFERRRVRVGIRDGELLAIEAGLAPGERLVTRGAFTVKLAASSTAVPDHGHAH